MSTAFPYAIVAGHNGVIGRAKTKKAAIARAEKEYRETARHSQVTVKSVLEGFDVVVWDYIEGPIPYATGFAIAMANR